METYEIGLMCFAGGLLFGDLLTTIEFKIRRNIALREYDKTIAEIHKRIQDAELTRTYQEAKKDK